MAKGRKWSINSRNERYLGSYSNGYAQTSNNGDESSELRDEDLWSMIHNNNSTNNHEDDNYGNITVKTRRRSSQRDERSVGGVSIVYPDSGRTTAAAFSERSNPRGRHTAASAPVNVPDWSKILRAESVESLPAMDDYDSDEAELVPPHEYLARNRNAAATSVFEGVGRTLKGRDMSRVRDAVWSQTGFDG